MIRTLLNFSTWKELESDLNAGRRVIMGQLYEKKTKKRHERPEIAKVVKNSSSSFFLHFCGKIIQRGSIAGGAFETKSGG